MTPSCLLSQKCILSFNPLTCVPYTWSGKHGNTLIIEQYIEKYLTERYCSFNIKQFLHKYFSNDTVIDELCQKLLEDAEAPDANGLKDDINLGLILVGQGEPL